MSKTYNYQVKKVAATPRNQRLTDGIQAAAATGGAVYAADSAPQYWELVTVDANGNALEEAGYYLRPVQGKHIVVPGDVTANATEDDVNSLPVAADHTTTGLFRAKQGGGLLYDTATNGWYVNPDFAGGGVNFTVGEGLQMSVDNELSVKYGKIAGTACQGNDARLSNDRKNPYKLSWSGGEYDGSAEKTLPGFLTVNDLSGYVKKEGDNMSGPLLMTLKRPFSTDTYKINIGANINGEMNPYISIFGNTYAKLHVNQGNSNTSKWTDYGSTTIICSDDYLIRTSNTASNDFKFTGKNFTAPGDVVANSTTTAFTSVVPVADNTTYGLVKYDNSTIKKNSDGQLYCTVQGGGSTGVVKYWRPSVNTSGVLSWTLSESESTPSSVNIKGPKGDRGATGATGQGVTYQWSGTKLSLGTINSSGNVNWGSYVDLKGPKGDPGSGGGSSSWNGGTVTNPIIAKASNSTQARIYGNDISTYSPSSYNQRLWLNYTCQSSNAEIYIGNGDNKGTQVATINSGGNGKILTKNGTGSLSDKRLKTIFERKEDILGKIQCINVYEYTRVDDENKILRVGVIAQEVAKTFPTIAVRDFVDDTNNEQYYTVDYATLGAVVAIGGCKELYAKYKEQQQTIDNLQSKLALLMQEVEKMKGGAV
nr:MAG TPA: endosialidase chaperone [Caudoviricetes sp.]